MLYYPFSLCCINYFNFDVVRVILENLDKYFFPRMFIIKELKSTDSDFKSKMSFLKKRKKIYSYKNRQTTILRRTTTPSPIQINSLARISSGI